MSDFKDPIGVSLSAPMTLPLIATPPTDARLHINALRYMEPGLIVFQGETGDGNPVKRQIGLFSAE